MQRQCHPLPHRAGSEHRLPRIERLKKGQPGPDLPACRRRHRSEFPHGILRSPGRCMSFRSRATIPSRVRTKRFSGYAEDSRFGFGFRASGLGHFCSGIGNFGRRGACGQRLAGDFPRGCGPPINHFSTERIQLYRGLSSPFLITHTPGRGTGPGSPKTPIPEPEFHRPNARQSNPKPEYLGKTREQFRPASPLPCSLRAARRT